MGGVSLLSEGAGRAAGTRRPGHASVMPAYTVLPMPQARLSVAPQVRFSCARVLRAEYGAPAAHSHPWAYEPDS